MDIYHIFSALLSRLWVVLATIVLTVAGSVWVVSQSPTLYRATATLLVSFHEPVESSVLPASLQEGYIATQVQVIRSKLVATRVVDKLDLLQDPTVIERLESDKNWIGLIIDKLKHHLSFAGKFLGTSGSSDQYPIENGVAPDSTSDGLRLSIADLLLANIRVGIRENTRLIDIAHISGGPTFSALIANAFADEYITTNLALNVETAKKNAEWIDSQLVDLRKKRQVAQEKLVSYQQEKGILGTDDRIDVEIGHLNSLTNDLAHAQAEAESAEIRLQQLDSVIKSGQGLDSLPTALANSYLQEVKNDLRRKEAEFADISTRVGKNHPEYKRLIAEIGTIRAKLKSEFRSISQNIRGEAKIARIKVGALTNTQELQKNKLLTFKQSGADLPALIREVESAQRGYDDALQQLRQYTMESRVNQTNAVILNRATPPSNSTGPSGRIKIGLGFVIGAIFGIGIAILLEIFDRKIHNQNDVAKLVALPFLGEISNR